MNKFKKNLFKKLNNSGFSLIELMIAIALLAVLMTPAYALILNGQSIFGYEVEYQDFIADVHMFFEYVNTHIRRAGFKGQQYKLNDDGSINVQESEDIISINKIPDPTDSSKFRYELNIKGTIYTKPFGTDTIIKGTKNASGDIIVHKVMVEHVRDFVVEKNADKGMITISVTLFYDDIEEVISTKIYERYQD